MTFHDYRKILQRIDPAFRFRHEAFAETVGDLLSPQTRWLDIGCGNNAIVAAQGEECGLAIGLDLVKHYDIRQGLFVQADLKNLPLRDEFADLVTLRLVVEHMDDIARDLSDIERVLKNGGKMVILTPNAWSPIVIVSRALPYCIKKWVIRRVFHEDERDIFPTFHHFNSPRKMRRGIGRLRLVDLTLIEQTSLLNPVLFWLFLAPVILTGSELLKYLRSNILATFEKV